MELALVFFAGIVVGILAVTLLIRTRSVGTLRVDRSDPDELYIFLELKNGIGEISSKKYVVLRVKLEDYIPHK